jgi:hypothetical protein
VENQVMEKAPNTTMKLVKSLQKKCKLRNAKKL